MAHLPIKDITSGPAADGKRHPELLDPQPNTIYRVDGRSLFATDEHGRVFYVRARLRYVDAATADATRHATSQSTAGGRDRRFKKPRDRARADRLRKRRRITRWWPRRDNGAHWVAASLGGPGEAINMAAVVDRINGNHLKNLYPDNEKWRRSLAVYDENWYRQEAKWRRLLKARGQVPEIELEVYVTYPKARFDDPGRVSERPKSFTAYTTIDNVPQEPMRFRNDTW